MPDPQEAQQMLEALALTGATAVVAAMATDAWQATRTGTARMFHRRGRPLEVIEAQLDGDAAVVEQDEDTDGARRDLAGPWKRRLVALLREHPDAEADLWALIGQVRKELPEAQQSWVQTNIARHGGQVFAAQGGDVVVHQAPPSPARPPTSSTVERSEDVM